MNRLCVECLTKWTTTGPRCTNCQQAYDKRKNAANKQRYNIDYRRARLMWEHLLSHEPQPCARGCGKLVKADMFHLDHMPDGQLLPSHPTCNIKGSHKDGNRKKL